MRDLGTLPGDAVSAGLGINSRGEVIGNSVSAPGPPMGNPRPFLWKNGVMTDLNTLITADSPLQLLTASSINDRGQITGFGVTSSGEIHAFLASPSYLSSPGAAANVTSAVVTPLTLLTNQPSVVLDGSSSTSASGNLQYLYEVVSGGLKPALLQTPNDPKATVDFVSGPGLYLVELIVTDSSGNSCKESGGYAELPTELTASHSEPRPAGSVKSLRFLPVAALFLLSENIERSGALYPDLGISVGPGLVIWIVAVGFANFRIVHFHAHAIIAGGIVVA